MAKGISCLLFGTFVLMYAKGGMTSSQFLDDFSVSIVDKQLISAVSTPQTSTPQTSTPQTSTPQTSTPQTSTPQTSTPQTSTPQTSTPQTSTPQTSTPQTSTPQTSTPQTSTPQTSTPQTSTPQTSTPQTSTPQTSTPQTSTPQTSTPRTSTPHSYRLRARQYRVVSIPHQHLIFSTDPVVERGTAGKYDKLHGRIEIIDDGTYLFIIHRVGVSDTNLPLLLEVNNAANEYVTIAEIEDNGEGSIFTANVLAELKSGNRVLIHTQGSDVIGDENQPFIFSMFLLNHVPIASFPVVRQSAFSVTGLANLLVADSLVDDFEPPTVNIGDGFDSLTGVFTAPFGGLYVFHLAITFTPKADGIGLAAVALEVNWDTVAQVYGRVPDIKMAFRYEYPAAPGRNSAITVAQNLNKGDEVTLRNVIATESLDGNVMFVGYLLS